MKKLCILLVLCLLLTGCAPAAAPELQAPSGDTSAPTTSDSIGAVTDPSQQASAPTQDSEPSASDTPTTKPDTPSTKPDNQTTQPDSPSNTPSQGGSKDCTKHVDDGDDGKCDVCGVTTLVIVDFYNINDLHGKIADADTHPGVDEQSLCQVGLGAALPHITGA